MISIRHVGLILVFVAILGLWALGLAGLLNLNWPNLFLTFSLGAFFLFLVHYFSGGQWLKKALKARRVREPVFNRLADRAGIDPPPSFYVTKSLKAANAFTVSYAKEDAIFMTPEIRKADEEIMAPIVAHEMAHIKNGDSLMTGFISAFGQIIGGMSQLWLLLIFGGPVGWLILLFFWPFILAIQIWSYMTLIVYQALTAYLMRRREYVADRTAAEWTSPQQMIKALDALESYNKNWFKRMFSPREDPLATHPALKKRIQRLKEMARQE